MARVLDRDVSARPNTAWLRGRMRRALSLRERLCDAPFYRLIHAEADGFPGVVIDRFGDVAVLQPNAAWAEEFLSEIVEAVQDVPGSADGRRHLWNQS